MTASRTRRKLLVAGAVILTVVLAVAVVAIPKYIANVTANQAKACELEYKSVQAGLVAYRAYFKLDAVASTDREPTSDMTKPLVLYPTFIRNASTTYAYGWDSTGRILSIAEARSSGPAIPNSCVPAG